MPGVVYYAALCITIEPGVAYQAVVDIGRYFVVGVIETLEEEVIEYAFFGWL